MPSKLPIIIKKGNRSNSLHFKLTGVETKRRSDFKVGQKLSKTDVIETNLGGKESIVEAYRLLHHSVFVVSLLRKSLKGLMDKMVG